jgi:hypothetical protein
MFFMMWAVLASLMSPSSAQADFSLLVDRLAPATPPATALVTSVAVIEVALDDTGPSTRLLYGLPPFTDSALGALSRWKFRLPPGSRMGRTSVTFLFRAPKVYAQSIAPIMFQPRLSAGDTPALPSVIVDPEYPVRSIAQDSVILRVDVDALGIPMKISAVHGDPSLRPNAIQAVRSWRFRPAEHSGTTAASTVYVVICYRRPV